MSRRRRRALLLATVALAARPAPPANGAPFLLSGGATLTGARSLPPLLPDGTPLDLGKVARAVDGEALAGDAPVAIDLDSGALYRDGAGSFRPVAPFLAAREGVRVWDRSRRRWRALVAAESLPALLAVPGAVAWRGACPAAAAACPADPLPPELFADGFDGGDASAWSNF